MTRRWPSIRITWSGRYVQFRLEQGTGCVCHEGGAQWMDRDLRVLSWMREGPSERDCRITLQTTGCCCALRGMVVSDSEKADDDPSGVAQGS